MANIIRQKSVTYIEWTVHTRSKLYSLPLLSSKIDSHCFTFQARKCKLEFYTDTSSFGDGCLYFKREGTLLPELEITVFVSWIEDSVQYSEGPIKCKITSRYEKIWRHEMGKLLGNSLTFHITVHSELSKRDSCAQTASYLNGDQSVESLSKDFSGMLDSGQNHDAEIRCGNHSIKVHKNVLSARSEVFKAMLDCDMTEGRTGIVEVQDTDISHIQEFLRYLYTGTIPDLTFVKAKALYEAGDKYLVRSLVLKCSEYLQDNLTAENACQCLVLANIHFDEKLKDTVVNYILDEKVYMQDEIWLPFCNSCPRLANELYRVLHERSGFEKKPAKTSEDVETCLKMTVLKKSNA